MTKMMKLITAGVMVVGMTGVAGLAQDVATTEASPSQTAEHTAQQRSAAAQEQAPSISAPENGASHSWTTEQLLTSSVHEAWILSGRNEDQFFEMVKELSAVSAQKRGLTLPESEEAGVKAGNWIKKEAKRDPDQLLYAVVDKAVMKVGVKEPAAGK